MKYGKSPVPLPKLYQIVSYDIVKTTEEADQGFKIEASLIYIILTISRL